MEINKENKNLNRRRAFRIYEQVNLLFHKIDSVDKNISSSSITYQLSQSLATDNSDSAQLLPDSHSQENDSLNVNISSSGISFTCKEDLIAGDYLIVRLLLLSSMTVIISCCKVVYIKPSNPFEKNRYPYQVGAQFINLKTVERELLHKHINKKKIQQLLVNGLITSFILAALLMPDMAVEFFLGICSFLIDELIEIVHVIYEIIEYGLDHLIENTFHTDLQATQTINFYTQIILAFAISYPLVRITYSTSKNILFCSHVFYCRKKASFFFYWGELSLLYKIGIISSIILVITSYLLFFI